MMVSTKGRYALRLMVDLALHDNGKFIALKDVSARQKISIKYLEQIVTPLNRAGLLKSGRGAQGGYRLAKKHNGLHRWRNPSGDRGQLCTDFLFGG